MAGTENAPAENVTREEVAALVQIGLAIAGREGRDEFETGCPHCKRQITTQTTHTRNEDADDSLRIRFGCLTVLFMVCALIMLYFLIGVLRDLPKPLSGKDILLGIFVFGFFCVFPLGATACSYAIFKDNYQDVEHSCPFCKASLGVSSGLEAWEEQNRRDAPARAAAITYAVTR